MSVDFNSTQDKWIKCISTSGTIRAVALTATEIVQMMAERHKTSEAGTIALAEAVVAGLLLASYCKSEEKVNLNIQGTGWCKQTIIDANANAEVRGYVLERDQKDVHLAKNTGPWGTGLMSVLRTKHEEAQPYIGTVPLLTGRLAKDLTFYWLQSEQVQSAVGIEVFMENDKVTLVEGFLIQALPGADDKDLLFIENHLKQLPWLDATAQQRSTPLNLLSYLLDNQSFTLLEEKHLRYHCPCSFDRMKRSVALVGAEELRSMIEEDKDIEIVCDFCSEKYIMSPALLETLIRA